MLATEVARFLSQLTGEERIEVGSSSIVDEVLSAGLARETTEGSAERAKLDELQGRLRAATGEDARRALRGEILAASENLALASGGAIVIALEVEGSAYRSGGSRERRLALTQRGRAFVSDHAPRAERAATLTLAQFEVEMRALRTTLASRGRRAAAIAAAITRTRPQAQSSSAWRSAAIGLAACREHEEVIASTFLSVFDRIGPRLAPWTTEQGVSAAECLCLIAPQLTETHLEGSVPALLDQRDELMRGACANRPEYALDASIVLAATPANARANLLHGAMELVRDTARSAVDLPLSTALICVATGTDADNRLAFHLAAHGSRLESSDAPPATAKEALALGLASGADPEHVVDRILAHRAQLTRFGASSLSAAALLAWIDAPLAETIDDLRICASVAQTHRLAVEPGETAGSAVKLLLLSAVLGTGDEGDPEEKLAFAARPHPLIARLGVGTVATSVPLLASVTAAFVRPLLDAAGIWDTQQRASQGYVHHGHHYG